MLAGCHERYTIRHKLMLCNICRRGGLAVNNKKDIHSITYLKTNASDVLQQVNETQRPVIITQNGEPRGVLQDARSYENMKNALGLMKAISQGEEDFREGNFSTQEDLFERLRRAIGGK